MNTKWILIAEDNPIDADLALRALSSENSKDGIVLAEDGAKALDCLYRRGEFESRTPKPPSVVVLDLKMPKLDGLQVLQKMKSDPQLRCIPVVMFTSSREENDLVHCYENGANAYVVKPVTFPEFRSTLQQLKNFWISCNEPPPGLAFEGRPTAGQPAPAT